ncbi:hypothetical protein JYT17_00665 [Nitrospira defluvii]|nr:hypothetical protein [Nitrospira defluvii]
MQSARHKREHYIRIWLPEPFISKDTDDISAQLERDETISMALLLALEKLSPIERAVFLLHDFFDFRFEEIATIIDDD